MRLVRFFDWRFLLALTVLVLVGSVCWTTIAQARDNEAKTRRIDILVATIAQEQAASARQRERLLDGQDRLNRKYDDLAEANQQMADLLTARGIPLPSSVTRIERRTQSDNDDNDDGGGVVIVEPPRPVRPSTAPPDDDDDNGETVPDVDDLTDMTDRIVDDLLNSVPEQ